MVVEWKNKMKTKCEQKNNWITSNRINENGVREEEGSTKNKVIWMNQFHFQFLLPIFFFFFTLTTKNTLIAIIIIINTFAPCFLLFIHFDYTFLLFSPVGACHLAYVELNKEPKYFIWNWFAKLIFIYRIEQKGSVCEESRSQSHSCFCSWIIIPRVDDVVFVCCFWKRVLS